MKKIEKKKEEPKKAKKEVCPADACQVLQDLWESGNGAFNANSKYCKACAKDFPETKVICEARTAAKAEEKKARKTTRTNTPMVKTGYGHKAGTQAALLDNCFIKGTTKEDILKAINSSGLNTNSRDDVTMWARVNRHIDDLKRCHNIIVTKNKDGLYKGKKA